MNKVYERRDINYQDGQYLLDMIKDITETYGIKPSDIEVEVGPGWEYGEAYGEAELCFYRPMTDEENQAEERRKRLLQEQIVRQKREQLERLKKELGET